MFNFKKIFNIVLIIFFVIFSLLFCLNKFNSTPLISGNNENLKIYELWHIESFEGGGKNRQNYLNSIVLDYEKINPTILFMIKNIPDDQLEEALKESTPHIISFSEQVAKTVLPLLVTFNNEYNIKDNYLNSAYYNNKLMALPFIASGYCYFTKNNNSKNLKLYTANNNQHNALSLVDNEIVNDNLTLSSYECYSKFVNNSDIKLLGTARDLFRIKNLENLGRFEVSYNPVSTFTDLIQYIGITTSNKTILNFIDYLMNNKNQRKLMDLSLFSTKHLNLYTEPTYSIMEQSLNQCYVPNIFNQ